MKVFAISDPKLPGSMSYALAPTKEIEKTIRENVAKKGFLAIEMPLEGSSDFWKTQAIMKKKMKT